MRPKTIFLLLIAVGCGLVASIGVSQYMKQASGNNAPDIATEKIFVAMTDINIGETLDAQNVKLEEWPKDRIPNGAIDDLSQLEERYPRTRLYAGEPILTAKLMDGNDRNSKAITIPSGYRAVSVKVSVDSSVSGLIQPGDRVDLLVFLRKNSEIPETGTRTILRDVNVFSVDGETERRVDSEGRTRDVRTVSLLVKPSQAESIMLASQLGQLFLTLRRPNDVAEEIADGETVQSLLGSMPEDANEKNDRPSPGEDNDAGFIDFLGQQAAAAASQQVPAAVEANAEPPAWTMQILTSKGHREFRWRSRDQLPEEVTQDSAQSPGHQVQPEPEPSLGAAAHPEPEAGEGVVEEAESDERLPEGEGTVEEAEPEERLPEDAL